MIEGEVDLILVAREPSQDELDLAEDNRVEIDIKPLALDAFVFIFNINNPVDGLTTDEIFVSGGNDGDTEAVSEAFWVVGSFLQKRNDPEQRSHP